MCEPGRTADVAPIGVADFTLGSRERNKNHVQFGPLKLRLTAEVHELKAYVNTGAKSSVLQDNLSI